MSEDKFKIPSKTLIQKLFNKNSEIKKTLEYASNKKIDTFLFYTDESNVLSILEKGIAPLSKKNLNKDEEYIVWSYQEMNDAIGLEFDNSSRINFWNWVSEQNIKIDDICTIGIDIEKLKNISKNDWYFDKENNMVYIRDVIDSMCIKWIMIKKRKNLEKYKTYIERCDLKIDIFLGQDGNIVK